MALYHKLRLTQASSGNRSASCVLLISSRLTRYHKSFFLFALLSYTALQMILPICAIYLSPIPVPENRRMGRQVSFLPINSYRGKTGSPCYWLVEKQKNRRYHFPQYALKYWLNRILWSGSSSSGDSFANYWRGRKKFFWSDRGLGWPILSNHFSAWGKWLSVAPYCCQVPRLERKQTNWCSTMDPRQDESSRCLDESEH